MTLEEAQMIAKIIGTADGGCSHCVPALAAHLTREFPQFVFTSGDYAPPMDDEEWESPWYGSRREVSVALAPSQGEEKP